MFAHSSTMPTPAAFVATHISVVALVRSHCPRAVPLFQNLSLLAQPGDHAVMAARARIVMCAPGVGAIVGAYFAAPGCPRHVDTG